MCRKRVFFFRSCARCQMLCVCVFAVFSQISAPRSFVVCRCSNGNNGYNIHFNLHSEFQFKSTKRSSYAKRSKNGEKDRSTQSSQYFSSPSPPPPTYGRSSFCRSFLWLFQRCCDVLSRCSWYRSSLPYRCENESVVMTALVCLANFKKDGKKLK